MKDLKIVSKSCRGKKPSLKHQWINTRVEYVWDTIRQEYVKTYVEGYWYNGSIALAMDTAPIWVAEDYRWVNDDGTHPVPTPVGGEATYAAAENTAITVSPQQDSQYRLRINFAETDGASGTGNEFTAAPILQYQINTDGWNTVGVLTDVRYFSDSSSTDNETIASTEHVLSYSGNEPDQAGSLTHNNSPAAMGQIWSNDNAEFEYTLNFAGTFNNGDVVTFRVLAPDNSTTVTFTNVPTANISTTATINDSIDFDVTTDKTLINQLDADKTAPFDITTDETLINQLDADKTAPFDITLDKSLIKSLFLTESDTFDITVDKNLINQRDANTLNSFDITTDKALINQLDANKTTPFDITANEDITKQLEAYLINTFEIILDEAFSGGLIISLSDTFDITVDKNLLNQLSIDKSNSFDITVDKSLINGLFLTESNTFGINNNLIKNFSQGIFDNYYYGSPDKYINDDVYKFIIDSTVKTGSITFTSQQDQQTTIQLTGVASQAIIASFLQNQTGQKDTNASATVNISLADFPEATRGLITSLLLNISNSQEQSSVRVLSDTVVINTTLDLSLLKQLLGQAQISLDTSLDFASTVQQDLTAVIDFLVNLTQSISSGQVAYESLNFDINTLHTPQVLGILNSTVTLINLLQDSYQKQAILNKAIEFLTDLQQQQTNSVDILKTINFLAEVNQVNTNTLTGNTALELALTATEQLDTTLSYQETIALIIQLTDTYSNTKDTPVSLGLNINTQQLQSSILNKLLAASFNTTLDLVKSSTVDWQLSVALTAELAKAILASAPGFIDEALTFQASLFHAITKQVDYRPAINLNASLQQLNTAVKTTAESINFNISTQQFILKLLDKALAITFNLVLEQVPTNKVDFQAIISLASTLTDLYIGQAAGALEAFVSFALQMQQADTTLAVYNKEVTFN